MMGEGPQEVYTSWALWPYTNKLSQINRALDGFVVPPTNHKWFDISIFISWFFNHISWLYCTNKSASSTRVREGGEDGNTQAPEGGDSLKSGQWAGALVMPHYNKVSDLSKMQVFVILKMKTGPQDVLTLLEETGEAVEGVGMTGFGAKH